MSDRFVYMMWAHLSASHKYPAHLLTQMTFRNVQRSVRILVPYSLYSALYHVHYIGNRERVYRERFRTQLLVPENANQNQPRKSLVIRVIGRALSITHSPVNGICDWNVRQPRATNRFRAKWSRPQERFFFFSDSTVRSFKTSGVRTLPIFTWLKACACVVKSLKSQCWKVSSEKYVAMS